jgi:hypothetical protein
MNSRSLVFFVYCGDTGLQGLDNMFLGLSGYWCPFLRRDACSWTLAECHILVNDRSESVDICKYICAFCYGPEQWWI